MIRITTRITHETVIHNDGTAHEKGTETTTIKTSCLDVTAADIHNEIVASLRRVMDCRNRLDK